MKTKIIAQNSRGNGILPMKQSKELEKLKSDGQKNEELCNFIKNAFVVSDDVSLVISDKEFKTNTYFLCKDKDRGDFLVAMRFIN